MLQIMIGLLSTILFIVVLFLIHPILGILSIVFFTCLAIYTIKKS